MRGSGIYSPRFFEPMNKKYTHEQRVSGGKARAASARRDEFGRMLPNNDTVLPEPEEHGRAGGLARANKARRDVFGRFIKD